MELLLQNHSSYPGGAASGARAGESLRAEIDAVIHEQEDAGMDIVTDGQRSWADSIAPLLHGLDGVRAGASGAGFGSAGTVRRPVITGEIRRRAPLLLERFTLAQTAARRRVKPVLPGPYTLARLAVIESGPYVDLGMVAHAFSAVLVAEVQDLVRAGATIIHIEEPAILSFPGDIRLLRRLLEPLWEARGAAELLVATHGSDASALYAELNSLPADIVAFDLCRGAALGDVIEATGASKVLALGLVDGCAPALEDPHRLAEVIRRALRRYELETLHVLPSCGLAALPRLQARAKLQRLTEARALIHPGA